MFTTIKRDDFRISIKFRATRAILWIVYIGDGHSTRTKWRHQHVYRKLVIVYLNLKTVTQNRLYLFFGNSDYQICHRVKVLHFPYSEKMQKNSLVFLSCLCTVTSVYTESCMRLWCISDFMRIAFQKNIWYSKSKCRRS